MNQFIKTRELIYISMIVALLIILTRSCERQQQQKGWQDQNDMARKDSITYRENDRGEQVAETASYQGESKQLKALIEENEQLHEAIQKFKSIETAVQVVTETKIVHDTIALFSTPISSDEWPSTPLPSTPLPSTPLREQERRFEKQTDNYSIAGSVDSNTLVIDELIIPNEQSIVVGEKKLGPFKREYRVEVTNSNELIQVVGLESYDFDIHNKRWAVSVVGGYGITGQGASPFIGLGVSYDLWEF